MKSTFVILLAAVFLLNSCGSDDDICTQGEATPRIKIKFKDTNNKLIQLSHIYIDADYGSGLKTVIDQSAADSVLVPLKIDGSGVTDLVVHTSAAGAKSTVRLQYTEEAKYVSPACGIRKLYKDLKTTLVNENPVLKAEQNQNEITDENKTHLYLIF